MTNKEVAKSCIVDYQAFDRQLKAETNLLEDWFIQQNFAEREMEAGTEIEFFLLDSHYDPAPDNLRFIDLINEPFLVTEVGKAHLEINTLHSSLSGSCLSILHENILSYWKRCCDLAQQNNYHLAMIGSLPTATEAHWQNAFLTSKPRYQILEKSLADQRAGKPFVLDIEGNESVILNPPSMAMNGLISAFQLHIQIGLSQSVCCYNAAQAIAGPMVALSANSPYFMGHDLWSESRIPLFSKFMTLPRFDRAEGVSSCVFGTGYLKDSFFELFDQNYQFFSRLFPETLADSPLEQMYHVRRHNGVIYRWNRPVVDFSEDGRPHLRIEHRAPSTGPTVVDMIANAAFFYGLIGYLTIQPTPIDYLLPFHQARKNFFNAARYGLQTQFKWFVGQEIDAIALLEQLVPLARKGLQILGIAAGDIDSYLGIISRRLAAKTNGCEWQKRFIAKYGKDFHAMMGAYLQNQYQELPIAEWPV